MRKCCLLDINIGLLVPIKAFVLLRGHVLLLAGSDNVLSPLSTVFLQQDQSLQFQAFLWLLGATWHRSLLRNVT